MGKIWVAAVVFGAMGIASANGGSVDGADAKWNIKVEAPQKGQRPSWGVSVGAYFPRDEDIRTLFGDTLIRFGVSPVSRKFDKKWDITTDVNILWANENGARLLVVPFTVGATIGFGSDDAKWYVAVNAGPAYYDYRLFRLSEVDGKPTLLEFRERTIGWNANVEGGILLNNRLSITGRYDWFKKADDFDFSGFSINVNYAFFKW